MLVVRWLALTIIGLRVAPEITVITGLIGMMIKAVDVEAEAEVQVVIIEVVMSLMNRLDTDDRLRQIETETPQTITEAVVVVADVHTTVLDKKDHHSSLADTEMMVTTFPREQQTLKHPHTMDPKRAKRRKDRHRRSSPTLSLRETSPRTPTPSTESS